MFIIFLVEDYKTPYPGGLVISVQGPVTGERERSEECSLTGIQLGPATGTGQARLATHCLLQSARLSYWDFILQCTHRERCMMVNGLLRRWLRLNPGLSSHVDVFQQILNVQCSECLNTVGLSGTWDICKANLSQYLQISILLLTIRICSISSMPKHRTMIGIRIGLRGWGLDSEDMTSLKVRIPTPKNKSHTLWSIYMRAQVY